MSIQSRNPYLVKAVVHSSQVLAAFRSPTETLSLHEICLRSGLPRSMAFRLLYTLHSCGMVEKPADNLYRTSIGSLKTTSYRLGYAAQTSGPFLDDILGGLQRAAAREKMEVIALSDRDNAEIALRNADRLIREKVDIVVQFEMDEALAPVLAGKYREANIPLIAMPHPYATSYGASAFYGANNYGAGLIGGRYLGKWARRNWKSQVDETVLFDLPKASKVVRTRLTGILAGMRETLPQLGIQPATYLNGQGRFSASYEVMRKHLRTSKARRFLVGSADDESALGALKAFEDTGRSESCAIIGQAASPQARAKLREPVSGFVGSVAFFPEKYGDHIVRLALQILHGRAVPPAVYVKHELITAETIDRFYSGNGTPTVDSGRSATV